MNANRKTRGLKRGGTFLPGVAGVAALAGKVVIGTPIGIVILLTTNLTFAQVPVPSFEVASIKPTAPGERDRFARFLPGGNLSVTNMSVQQLMVTAFRIQPFQISGAPAWLNSESYDITAKGEEGATQNQIPEMLQSLLADRFGLRFHRETKEMGVYALLVAKAGKATPGLTESREGSCMVRDPTVPAPLPPPGQPLRLFCGSFIGSSRGGLNLLDAKAVSISQLIPMLSGTLGRAVIEKTGLTAKYDVHFEWTPDQGQTAQNQSLSPDVTAGPSIFTALQEQARASNSESQKGSGRSFGNRSCGKTFRELTLLLGGNTRPGSDLVICRNTQMFGVGFAARNRCNASDGLAKLRTGFFLKQHNLQFR